MQGPPPLCFYCRHRRWDPGRGTHCAAFPDGVPQAVLQSRADHRQALAGDHGIAFEPREDAPQDLFAWTVEALDAQAAQPAAKSA
ncbi:MAG: hypothetical protein HYU66_18000 [Armatimonadetes bacterium]|nr:hypothetical protein [Armatimonadota bacterium]